MKPSKAGHTGYHPNCISRGVQYKRRLLPTQGGGDLNRAGHLSICICGNHGVSPRFPRYCRLCRAHVCGMPWLRGQSGVVLTTIIHEREPQAYCSTYFGSASEKPFLTSTAPRKYCPRHGCTTTQDGHSYFMLPPSNELRTSCIYPRSCGDHRPGVPQGSHNCGVGTGICSPYHRPECDSSSC